MDKKLQEDIETIVSEIEILSNGTNDSYVDKDIVIEGLSIRNNLKRNEIESAINYGINNKILQEDNNRIKIAYTTEKKSARVTIIPDDMPVIKEGKNMQSSYNTMWYEQMDVSTDKIVDNNDVVDLESIQIKAPESISSIRKKILNNKPKDMSARPGQYVLFYNKKIIDVGNLSKIKELTEKIIMDNENINDDDLVIFLRVPINKILK